MKKALFFILLTVTGHLHTVISQKITIDRNKPERLEWFGGLAFGMFIHWSLDVQVSAVISHSLAVSSKDYQDRYFNELPKTFNPKKFDPDEWAVLARLAGMKYMVFTAKHHNGFCMWDTKTTDFSVMNTPFGRDALKEIIDAFRKQGIAIGLYFSPDDFHVMYKQGYPISRASDASQSTSNTALWELNKKQLRELLTGYGKIDILFIDENADWANLLVANYAWDLDPDLIITRGGMATPEKFLPGQAPEGLWEACYTIGTHWQYVGEEKYKSPGALIDLLIETRAKGGNLLLNVGPDAHGEIPLRQENRLREMGLWLMANHEAIYNVKPWEITKENDIWFTASEDRKTVYAFVNTPYWKRMEEKAFFIRPVRGTPKTAVSVLGQGQEVMEYNLSRSPRIIWSAVDEGIFVNVIKAQRLTDTWSNPMVIKLENVTFGGGKKK